MKRFTFLFLTALLLGAGCAQDQSTTDRVGGSSNENQEEMTAENLSFSGVVTKVYLDGIAADGPAIVIVETDLGAVHEVDVPSFGLPLCAASEQIADVFALQEGDRVEVNGSLTDSGIIVPCESADHYLRVLN